MPRTAGSRPGLARHALLTLLVATPLCLAIVRPARACGWDWETYHAEARSLPCVFDTLLGFWPKHSDEYHRTRIQAADHALDWMPGWTPALDAMTRGSRGAAWAASSNFSHTMSGWVHHHHPWRCDEPIPALETALGVGLAARLPTRDTRLPVATIETSR